MRKAEQILRFIASSPSGRRYGEIVEFICNISGRDYEERSLEYKVEWTDENGSTIRNVYGLTSNEVLEINGFLFEKIFDGVRPRGRILSKKIVGRANRGYYSTNLNGSWKQKGILDSCIKVNDSWHVKEQVRTSDFKNPVYLKTPRALGNRF